MAVDVLLPVHQTANLLVRVLGVENEICVFVRLGIVESVALNTKIQHLENLTLELCVAQGGRKRFGQTRSGSIVNKQGNEILRSGKVALKDCDCRPNGAVLKLCAVVPKRGLAHMPIALVSGFDERLKQIEVFESLARGELLRNKFENLGLIRGKLNRVVRLVFGKKCVVGA